MLAGNASAAAASSQTAAYGAEDQSAAAGLDQAPATPQATVMTVVVPDGSWEHAHALVRALAVRRTALGLMPHRYVRLADLTVEQHESPLIEALKAGAGRGRLSTLEACAMMLAEAEESPPNTGPMAKVFRGLAPVIRWALPHAAPLPAVPRARRRGGAPL